MNARGRTQFAPTEKDREHKNPLSFFTRLAPQGIVGYTFSVLSGGNIAFLREEGGTRQGFPEANEMSFGGSLRCVTEGDRATLSFRKFHCIALSLSRFATAHSRREPFVKSLPTEKHHQRNFLGGVRYFSANNAEACTLVVFL